MLPIVHGIDSYSAISTYHLTIKKPCTYAFLRSLDFWAGIWLPDCKCRSSTSFLTEHCKRFEWDLLEWYSLSWSSWWLLPRIQTKVSKIGSIDIRQGFLVWWMCLKPQYKLWERKSQKNGPTVLWRVRRLQLENKALKPSCHQGNSSERGSLQNLRRLPAHQAEDLDGLLKVVFGREYQKNKIWKPTRNRRYQKNTLLIIISRNSLSQVESGLQHMWSTSKHR